VQNLLVLGSANIAHTLTVSGDAVFDDNVTISHDLDVLGDLTVAGTSTFTTLEAGNVDINGDLTVTGNTTFEGDVTIDENLYVKQTLHAQELSIVGFLNVGGDVTFHKELTVEGDVVIEGDLTVLGGATVNGRFDIVHGPLGFPYNGTEETVNPTTQARTPYTDLVASYGEFVVSFAPVTDALGQWYDLTLSGFTLNFLEPGLNAPHVYRLETISIVNILVGSPPVSEFVQSYRYEVGDIIFLKGPSNIDKLVTLWDFQDILSAVGATQDGNIYNGRSIVTEAMSIFTEILHSDEIVMYMYSPRPGIGALPTGTVIQEDPVEWVKLM